MDKTKILFVCMGNICRSPSAEAVFTGLVKNNGLAKQFEIDSAGTTAYHAGQRADRRMQSHALKRGFNLTSISRHFNPSTDFDYFDMIIGMDDDNMHDLKRVARSEADLNKLYKMTDFSREMKYNEVPDPYYGGDAGFELVLDLLEDACEGLLDKINQNKI
ncbi:low molecular weight protein-tyrosine-phosphatase [uncultured Draconibacterium sp.]|uniref:low molecular weight protein-tyrosine-phosphatase n=1 Tax=uncultured Draconibacterium sp. TaxID=1573823 RepID=UPI003216B21A